MVTEQPIGIKCLDVTTAAVYSASLKDQYEVTLYPNYEILLTNSQEVLWFKNNLLVRKLKYDNKEDKIISSHIVHFNNDNNKSQQTYQKSKKKALTVVLTNRAYIYFEDDETFIVSFPFSVRKSFLFENGLILERSQSTSQDSTPMISSFINTNNINNNSDPSSSTSGNSSSSNSKPNFLTLLGPLSELGMLVSSSISSFAPNEELVWFPQDSDCSLAVTYNSSNSIITIYHVRYLTRNKNKSSGGKRTSLRKRSISRKSSMPNGATISNDTEINEGTPKPSGNNNKDSNNSANNPIQARRSISHSEMLYDRMPSGNTGADITNLDINDTSFTASNSFMNIEALRKDAVLTKVEKVQFKYLRKSLKVFSLHFTDKQGIVIVNKETKNTEVLIFNSSNNSVSLPSYQSSFNFRCSDAVALDSTHDGYLIALKENGKSACLVNPFLGLTSHDLLLNFKENIEALGHCSENCISLKTFPNSQIRIVQLLLEPLDELNMKCLKSLKHIFGPYAYEFVWLKWCTGLSFDKDGSGWQSFIITLLSIIVPAGTDFSDLVNSPSQNFIINQLYFANLLNQSNNLKLSQKYEQSLNSLAPNAILALHLIREELKLNILRGPTVEKFDILLAQFASWSGWSSSWVNYYLDTKPSDILDKKCRFRTLQPFDSPPNLLRSLCSIFSNNITPYITFSQISEENDAIDEIITPRTYYILRIFEAIVSPQFTSADIVNLMVEYGIDSFDLESYPIGISLPLKEYLASCIEDATVNSSLEFVELLGRKDLAKIIQGEKATAHKIINHNHLNNKDVNQVIQSIKNDDPIGAWDGQSEAEKLHITKLIFSEDRRYYEITKILQSSKIQTVTLNAPPNMNEYSMVNLQKELSTLVSLRTMTIPLGRGALFLSSRMPILTEKFPIPKLNFDTLIMPSNITLSLDKNLISSEIIDWGYFHNGASAGMTILKNAKNIVGSWIVFNKPHNLNSQHGGFLLALGLNGHLKNLEEWHMYNYLGPKHTHTSVGLLLGLSASARATMDMKLTKVLSVHVVALLPQGATDLNVSLPVQTAGLVGIGLLYLETQHRRMSDILLSQISNKISYNDRLVVDEGYRLAAGIALGYTNLGKGNHLKGLNDTHITDQLLSMAVSLKDMQGDQEYDKSAPGAIIALGFIYLRTNNYNIAYKLMVPETEKLLDYIRPDLLLLRIVVKNMILWNDVQETKSWVKSQVPKCLTQKYSIADIKSLDSDQLPYFNCIGGACVSIALKFASSGDITASETILYFLDHFMRLTIMAANSFDEKITQSSLLIIQDAIVLSSAIIMAGTGDLNTFRRLRIVHNRTTKSLLYSNYAAVSMALGFLFMGSGEYTFDDSNFSIAALFTAIYPAPAGGTESEIYLQALRHFWVLAAKPRCLVFRDVETDKPVEVQIKITLNSGKSFETKAPCLIPKLQDIRSIETTSKEYYTVLLSFDELMENQKLYEHFKKNLTVFVYKRQDSQKSTNLLRSIVQSVSKEFDQKKRDNVDKAYDILFENCNTIKEHELNGDLSVKNSRLEIRNMVKDPRNSDDLWNIKLLFAFYEKVDDIETHYLSTEFVETLKTEFLLS
ncbi:anaphase promoting complex subunit 1 [Saccharomycopsis crataegensis]|uniref:Anaphase promoting complex subunit 1 n=1 Tax=Saccharomycopsis crataegensis TaxID=43959 RepID=A0AAV5QG50_9ASCO|nr:anaphase promoting complex subunit 1 [Saccharomycopsis crataegensis]